MLMQVPQVLPNLFMVESSSASKVLDIWHTALTHGPILWDSISSLLLIHFLFTDLVKFSTLMVNGKKFS
jgi:hypothetical protein